MKNTDMRRLFTFWFLAAMLPGFAVNAQQNIEQARAILDKMSAKYQGFDAYKASFIYVFENELDGYEEKVSGELIVQGDMFRLSLAGQEIYCNGEIIWTYIQENNEVNIDYYLPEEMEMSPTRIYDAYKKGYTYRLISNGSSNEARIQLNPEVDNQNFSSIILVVNTSNSLLNSWVIEDKAGNKFTYTITALETKLSLDPKAFVFDPQKYPGVEIIDLR